MPWGLNDDQRRRLEREREKAERKMAKERQRIEPILAREHEHFLQEQAYAAAEAAHRTRFGPKTVTGPDHEPVQLEVRTAGQARFRDPPRSKSAWHGGAPDDYKGLRLDVPISLWQLIAPDRFVLRIYAAGLKQRSHVVRLRDEDTAARLVTEMTAAVEARGLDGLRRWIVIKP
ncbi:MAG: hypothetical protein HOU81_16130 [Hamadaea sp.]|uniref:hypothetical protein n=1 Tax=Hamadaea sp. TaxID=2024425 RepID=UPI0017BC5BD1|nr:hypothetical protein [Hamadaea sp.]NUR72343.1 hypothetical protein [Hamadaea sp.]NUT18450.1 hypothetical protein [Hamadaea sp.]